MTVAGEGPSDEEVVMLLQNVKTEQLDRMMKALWMVLAAAVGLLVWSIVTIAKADVPLEQFQPDDTGAVLKMAVEAIASGNLWLAAAIALSFAVWLLRVHGVQRLPDGKVKAFLGSDIGGVILTVVSSFFGALVTALVAGSAVDGVLLLSAVKVALAAMGGYVGVKKALPKKPAETVPAPSPGA